MTETKTLNRDTPTEKPNDKPAEAKRFLDLSATQLTGGALAAMTSAVIGARLGVAGTIIGAAIGSIVAGIAGSLYTASLKHTKDKITSVIVGHADDATVAITPVSDDTAVLDNWNTTSLPTAPTATVSREQVAAQSAAAEPGAGRRRPWKGILISTAAVFLLAIAGITAFELVSGHAISGGQGTTITQVNEGRSASTDAPSEDSSTTPSSQTSTEPSSSAGTDSESSTSATSEPTAEATSSAAPSTEPTESSDPATSEPTTTSNPSGGGDVGAAGASAGTGTAGG